MPMWTAVLVGAVLLGAGGLTPYVVARAANGRLARNRWVGVRTPGTLASDGAWRSGHAAARPWALAAGALMALAGLASLVIGAASGSPGMFALAVVGGAALGSVVLVAGAVRADAAARGDVKR
ncbi:SdpI/YhfL protein family protein [Quadrisphaera granulorum]|uniref:SdpI/YhfL family protein n=1 Tax=Quadrisphaera granulorum TaxID=317664 RepID=A0A316B186_9ACTN|nr:SdpI/YhfL family protein [Quadrisphaera granulorum]SZE94911.1 SdpI/YhfL protein family protein [Quadrisphaera granulorum]